MSLEGVFESRQIVTNRRDDRARFLKLKHDFLKYKSRQKILTQLGFWGSTKYLLITYLEEQLAPLVCNVRVLEL